MGMKYLWDSNIAIYYLQQQFPKTAEIRKKYNIKLPDAIIAATAIVYGLKLVTRNEKDFAQIKGLNIINPFNIK
jgi:predicted nucleic acid-binding protein